MRVIINERQYGILLKEDRILNLKNKFIITPKEIEFLENQNPDDDKYETVSTSRGVFERLKDRIEPLTRNGVVIAYLITKNNKVSVKVTEEIFNDVLNADPTSGKYIEWILGKLLKGFVNDNYLEDLLSFLTEELDTLKETLENFEKIKKTRDFKGNASTIEGAPSSPSEIKSYESLTQLRRTIHPFLVSSGEEERGEGDELSKEGLKLFKQLNRYGKLGQAIIDILPGKRVLIYRPLTLVASCEPLGSLSSWCTRTKPRPGTIDPKTGKYTDEALRSYSNHFLREKERYPKPSGGHSDYYVIMPLEEIFKVPVPSSNDFYPLQFHIEGRSGTGEYKNKFNEELGDLGFEKLNSEYPEVIEYFKNELGVLAGEYVEHSPDVNVLNNIYFNKLKEFGGSIEGTMDQELYDNIIEKISTLAIQDDSGENDPLYNKNLMWLYNNNQDFINTELGNNGLERIKDLASLEAKKGVKKIKENTHLVWLIEHLEGFNIMEYITPDTFKGSRINFNGIYLGTIPDLSDFTVGKVTFEYCGLTDMPDLNMLPNNLFHLSLKGNNIKNVDFANYPNDMTYINLLDNPIENINIKSIEYLMLNNDLFLRLLFPKNINENIKNEIIELKNKMVEEDFEIIFN